MEEGSYHQAWRNFRSAIDTYKTPESDFGVVERITNSAVDKSGINQEHKDHTMSANPVADGHYRIRKAGAKSEIAKAISNGKKCHYVQIGIEMTGFSNLEDAMEFVADKDLVADRMSLDFGMKPAEPEVEETEEVEDDATPEAAE